jgi:hypothetical protein
VALGAERLGERVAKVVVLLFQSRDAFGRGVQAAQQGGVGGALAVGDDGGW